MPGDSERDSADTELSEVRCAALRAIYEELCKSHDGVSEFRAKLLALLPLASGTGLFAVINIDQVQKLEHLLAIGIFGGLVALALYLYEIRGIQRCEILTLRAKAVEDLLSHRELEGAFAPLPEMRFRLASNTLAAAVIYPSTISVWAYVAFCGVDPSLGLEPLRVPISVALFFILMLVGYSVSKSELKHCREEAKA